MHFIRKWTTFRLSHPTVSGVWYAYLWMMIGALVLSLLLQSGTLEEAGLELYVYIVHSAAIFFGGVVSGKRSGQKGWFQGSLTGICYGIILMIISFLALDTSLSWNDLIMLLPAGLIGLIGGVIGVNFSSRRS